ncbi:hypothetical protein P4V41_21200 [Fictibacillus nanhaiensis]|uniref:hypothetical protein n=1 Tax=Fictibacillus nanhaiensis TaxID=742169 RepID=UPI002E234231|nr:hypothetical protein [Fictibacillus nanhaiensis]
MAAEINHEKKLFAQREESVEEKLLFYMGDVHLKLTFSWNVRTMHTRENVKTYIHGNSK